MPRRKKSNLSFDSRSARNSRKSRNKKKINYLQPVKTKSNSSKNAPRIGTQNHQIMDDVEFETFAKNIAFQLRELPYYNAKQCQEKIKKIINQGRFIAQQSHHQELDRTIIEQEPGWSDEEPLQSVSSQETIQTKIKEKPVISEDEYPHPVLGHGTIHTILNQKTTLSEKELYIITQKSRQKELERIIIEQEPGLSEEELSHPVSSQETIQTILNQESVTSRYFHTDYQVKKQYRQ